MPEKRFSQVLPESLDDIVPVRLTVLAMQSSLFEETTYRRGASYSPAMPDHILRQVGDASFARSLRARS
jgi:hypothetical protein